MTEQAPIVVVGTGLAGYSLVRELRKLDAQVPVLMVTADDGASYSKPMLSTALTKNTDADGLIQARAEDMAVQLDVEIRTGTRVTGIDVAAHQLLLGDERLNYSRLILALGAEVIRPPLEGDALERVFSVNDLGAYRGFRRALQGCRRVAIIGAGLIGCEFANDLRNGGFEVEMITPADTVMPGLLPQAAGEAVAEALTSLGVRMHTGTTAVSVERSGEGVCLHLADGGQIQADLVLSATGLRPHTELARDAGLEVGRGIRVNRALETSAADVYALGDCAEVDGRVLMYVLPLMAGARALAKTLAGERTEVRYGVMPVMVKTPCCATAVCPPPAGADGAWDVQKEGTDVRALFRSASGQLLGFALTGRFVVEKQALSREVPPLHS